MLSVRRIWFPAAVFCLLPIGCAPKATLFHVVNYRDSGAVERFFQEFDTCYYARDAHGNIDIVANLTTDEGEGLPTEQTVHIRTFWIPKPGVTNAERTMINTTVCYVIVSGATGATFEGSGFVTFKENRAGEVLTGRLELSSLSPSRRLGAAQQLFERAELSGSIVALRDKAKVVGRLNEIRRVFGPLPRHDASSEYRDIR